MWSPDHIDEARLVDFAIEIAVKGTSGSFSGIDDIWPWGQIDTFYDSLYPMLDTEATRRGLVVDHTDIADDKEYDYLLAWHRAAFTVLPLANMLEAAEQSRTINNIVVNAIARRRAKIYFLLERLAQYPVPPYYKEVASYWTTPTAISAGGTLFTCSFHESATAEADYDLNDLTEIDARLDNVITLLNSIDADSDMVKFRLAVDTLHPDWTSSISVKGAVVDPSKIDVWRQMAVRRNDPDVSDRTAQFPDIANDANKVRVYASPGVEPSPYLLTMFRPWITFEDDNKGTSNGALGMILNTIDSAISTEYESFCTRYNVQGTATHEAFDYNENQDSPVAFENLYPHLWHGDRALQDSAVKAHQTRQAFHTWNSFLVPIEHIAENTMLEMERMWGVPASFVK
jgi:hypothetical protein